MQPHLYQLGCNLILNGDHFDRFHAPLASILGEAEISTLYAQCKAKLCPS